jgi:hypothetical protein
VPREAVDVRDVAHGLLALEPVVGELALVVEEAQLGIAPAAVAAIASSSRAPSRESAGLAVELGERVAQLGEERSRRSSKRRVPADAAARALRYSSRTSGAWRGRSASGES